MTVTQTKEFSDLGSIVTVGPQRTNSSDKLSAGFYSISVNPEMGYFLKKQDSFKLPEKLYSNCQPWINRSIRTYKRRSGNTGILLSGTKGAGKTIMAKQLCNQMCEDGYPVIIINSDYRGEGFNRFIESLGPCVILIDEFEKVYDTQDQPALLTMFDGTLVTNNLILLTVNESHKIIPQFHGRPGRIYLKYEFGKLEREIVEMVCDDLLSDNGDKSKILSYYMFQDHFTFDILMTLIDELNHNDFNDFDELIRPLNIKNSGNGPKFRIKVTNETLWGDIELYSRTVNISLSDIKNNMFGLYPPSISDHWSSKLDKIASGPRLVSSDGQEVNTDKEVAEKIIDYYYDNHELMEFGMDDLTDMDHKTGNMVFSKDGYKVEATPMVNEHMSISNFFGVS